MAFAPDGTMLAAGLSARANDLSSLVEVWTVAGGHVKTLDAPLAVIGPFVVFARSAPLCAVSDREGVKLYKLPSFALEHEFSFNGAGETSAVALSPDGAVLALAVGGSIHLYAVPTGAEYAVLEKHEKGVSAIVFAPDGKTLISGGHDRTVREWTVPAPK